MTQIHDLTALEQAAAVRDRELSPVEIVDHYLDRIDKLNETVGAYVTVTADLALEQARKAERAVMDAAEPAQLPPLYGVPIPIKDLNLVAGVRTTFGSATYADFVPSLDDSVVERLREAGTIMLGKTQTPEFGLPCYTENAVGSPARTPWDLGSSAGGSSGGAAAAVAAGLAPAAHGSDGGGSIRIPSSVCGLFGIKPSRGRISNAPLTPDLLGLATHGPIARTVRDAAALLDAMAHNKPGDAYVAPPPPAGSFLAYADSEPGELRIARTATPAVADAEVHPECVAAYEEATLLLTDMGHQVVDVAPPFEPDIARTFGLVWAAMSTVMPVDPARVDRLLPFTTWLRERGSRVLAAEYLLATATLQRAVRAALAMLDTFDAVLTPTLAQPPVPVGYFTDAADPRENFQRQKRFTPFTAVYNLTGQPAVSVPLYWTRSGTPIGVMLAGRWGEEGTLISLSAQLEAARPWAGRHPRLW